jgi:hypothetical protein
MMAVVITGSALEHALVTMLEDFDETQKEYVREWQACHARLVTGSRSGWEAVDFSACIDHDGGIGLNVALAVSTTGAPLALHESNLV